jgi:GTPase
VKSRTFVDTVTLHAKGGNGGNGCASFRREKFVAYGGPDGGDGGRGGNVILRCNHDENSLIRLYFAPHQRARNGGHGKGKQLHGRNGKDLYVPVPPGTEVWDPETGVLLGDIVEHEQELLVARGGRGGRGNVHWKSSTHQAPTEHTGGGKTEQITLRLKLKLVADMGLVGFPNAGKSSVLTGISDAHPKIGAYPFTTLNPIIGTLIFEDYSRLTVADIPGLIEGAHEGIGLGHAFLRHIERAACLVYIIDMAGMDGRSPHEDYLSLRRELEMHREDLATRPALVVANKMDVPDAEEQLAEFKAETGTDPIRISATTGEGLAALKAAMQQLWKRERPA